MLFLRRRLRLQTRRATSWRVTRRQQRRRRPMATDLVDRARTAVHDRAELPGMSLMEHLEELRTRLFWIFGYLLAGFIVAWVFRNRLVGYIQQPLVDNRLKMTMNDTN